MPLSGYTATMPNEILLNPALISIGSVLLGVTKGGVTWDPEMTTSDIAFDGQRGMVKGLTRISKRGGKLSGTLLQIASAVQVQKLELGATTATSTVTGVSSVITPKDAGTLFVTGDYVTDLRAVWETGQGTGHYFAIHIPCAICLKYGIKGADNGEADVTFEFAAVLDMTVSGTQITDPSYVYEMRTALP